MPGRLVDSDGEQLATRSDFERLKAAFHRALWIHGGCIVAIAAALEFLP